MTKVRWGILSTAKIGREKVIPAMQAGQYSDVVAIASANKESANNIAKQNHIAKVYDSYDALLADPEIDAVNIPLPNHLHVQWAIKSLQAGKHVLCEKPIGLCAAEAEQLQKISQQFPDLKLMEAFMYRFHPQWLTAKKLVSDGSIGELKTIQSFFSYYNVDPHNIRNKKEIGGGVMMDIGCYCISLARFIFDKEPGRVLGIVEFDPVLQTDRMASGILDFGTGTSSFTCATQLAPCQRVNIIGTEARIEIEMPFNPPPDIQTRIWLHAKNSSREIVFNATDQYTIQGDLFSQAILNNEPVPTPFTDAINNMKIIEAVFESAKEEEWKKPAL
ncbi:MAG: Gfo/Idh/MocA family oxidoreductase [Ferruginibacter sp.]